MAMLVKLLQKVRQIAVSSVFFVTVLVRDKIGVILFMGVFFGSGVSFSY